MTNPVQTSTSQIAQLRSQKSFFGHPKAIGTLSFMQLCNSFANYGMSAILVYYLYAAAPEGLGFTQENAAQLVSLYSAVSILTGIIGSYVADRVLGPRKALGLARSVHAVAYLCLAIPFFGVYGYVASQALLCLGTMLSGRSLEALTGKMYEKEDKRRDGAFAISYVISNIGAAAPAISGTVALMTGYNVAFAMCAVFAVLGVVSYYATEKKFFGPIGQEPDDPLSPEKKKSFMVKFVVAVVAAVVVMAVLFTTGILTINVFANFMSTAAIFIPVIYLIYIIKSPKTEKEESKHVLYLIPMYVTVLQCWYGHSPPPFWRSMQNRELTEICLALKSHQQRSRLCRQFWQLSLVSSSPHSGQNLAKKQPSAPTKIGIGTIFWGCGPLFMIIPFVLYAADVKVSPMWLVMFYVLIIFGEAITNAVGYSSASLVAPKAFTTQMMTVWSMSQSTGAALSTLAVNFYHEGSEATYFLMIGGITCLIGLLVMIFAKKIEKGMGLADSKQA